MVSTSVCNTVTSSSAQLLGIKDGMIMVRLIQLNILIRIYTSNAEVFKLNQIKNVKMYNWDSDWAKESAFSIQTFRPDSIKCIHCIALLIFDH